MEKEILLKAWKSFRSRPLVWLLVSAASVPYILALSSPASEIVLLLGFLVTYILVFMAWCMAAYAFGGEPEASTREMLAEARDVLAYQPLRFLNLSSIFALGVFVLTAMIVPMLVNMIAMMVNATEGIGIFVALSYLSYVLIALAITLFALAPQLAMLRHDFEEETTNPSGILRVSYEMVKNRYQRAALLVVVPELVADTALLAFRLLLIYFASDIRIPYALVYIPALLVLSFVEGAKTSFIAAAFNHFLDQVEAEEKEIRKKKKSAKDKEAKSSQQKKSQPGKTGTGGKTGAGGKKQLPSSDKKPSQNKSQSRKPGPSPHKKKK